MATQRTADHPIDRRIISVMDHDDVRSADRDEILAENKRLRELVAELSAIIARNVVTRK